MHSYVDGHFSCSHILATIAMFQVTTSYLKCHKNPKQNLDTSICNQVENSFQVHIFIRCGQHFNNLIFSLLTFSMESMFVLFLDNSINLT